MSRFSAYFQPLACKIHNCSSIKATVIQKFPQAKIYGSLYPPPFRLLLTFLHLQLIDPCLITSYDDFHEYGITIRTIKHSQKDLSMVLFLKKESRPWMYHKPKLKWTESLENSSAIFWKLTCQHCYWIWIYLFPIRSLITDITLRQTLWYFYSL